MRAAGRSRASPGATQPPTVARLPPRPPGRAIATGTSRPRCGPCTRRAPITASWCATRPRTPTPSSSSTAARRARTSRSSLITFAAPSGADTVAPETTIGVKPPNLTRETDASFDFSADEEGATFECKLDDGQYGACTPPISYVGLAAGVHTFSVRATDEAGNEDDSPAVHTWTVDNVQPETTITGMAGGADQLCGNRSARPRGCAQLLLLARRGGLHPVHQPGGRRWARRRRARARRARNGPGRQHRRDAGATHLDGRRAAAAATDQPGAAGHPGPTATAPAATRWAPGTARATWWRCRRARRSASSRPDARAGARRRPTCERSRAPRRRSPRGGLDTRQRAAPAASTSPPAWNGDLHLYALDWDNRGRRQTLTVDDGSGPRIAILDAAFTNGLWAHAPVTVPAGGSVRITVSRSAGTSAVLSGLFLGGAVPRLPTSQAPQGTWTASYGAGGYALGRLERLQRPGRAAGRRDARRRAGRTHALELVDHQRASTPGPRRRRPPRGGLDTRQRAAPADSTSPPPGTATCTSTPSTGTTADDARRSPSTTAPGRASPSSTRPSPTASGPMPRSRSQPAARYTSPSAARPARAPSSQASSSAERRDAPTRCAGSGGRRATFSCSTAATATSRLFAPSVAAYEGFLGEVRGFSAAPHDLLMPRAHRPRYVSCRVCHATSARPADGCEAVGGGRRVLCLPRSRPCCSCLPPPPLLGPDGVVTGSPGWWLVAFALHLPLLAILGFLAVGLVERFGFYCQRTCRGGSGPASGELSDGVRAASDVQRARRRPAGDRGRERP